MAKQIKQSDFIDPNALDSVAKDLHEIAEQGRLADEALKRMAQSMGKIKVPDFNVKELSDFDVKLQEINKMYVDKIAIDKESIKTQQELEKLNAIRQRNEIARAKEADRIAKKEAVEAKRRLKDETAQQSAFQKTQKRASELYQQLRDLAIVGDTNSKSYKNLKREYDSLDKSLKKVDESFGKNFRNVGNYSKAINGLRGGLAKLGLAFGGLQIVRGAGALIVDFEQNIQNLGALTGKTGDDLDELKQKVIGVSNETGKGASEIANAMQLIGSAQPELLKNADALASVTKQAVLLSQAGGIDVPQAADALTKSMNQFGVGAEEAAKFVDILATSQQKGTAPIAQLSEAMVKAGGTVKAFGGDFETANALLQGFAKGGVVGSEAGTQLSGILSKLAKTQNKDFNPQFTDSVKIIDNLAKANLSYTDLVKLTDAEGAKWLTTIINQNDVVQSLNGNLNDQGSALEQANQRMDTVNGQYERATTALQNYILGSEGATVVSDGLKNVLGFLADNISTIIPLLIKLGAIYLVMIARQKVLNSGVIDWTKNLFKAKDAVNDVSKGMTSGASNAAKFGKALKGIGLSAAIGLLIEMALALYDVASGAARARHETELFQKASAKGAENATKANEKTDKILKDQLKSIQERRSLNEITAKEELELNQKAYAEAKKRTDNLVSIARDSKNSVLEQLAVEKERLKQMEMQQSLFGDLTGENFKALEKQREKIAQLKASEKEHTETIIGLKNATNDYNDSLFDNTIEQNENNKSTNNAKQNVIDYTKAIRDLQNELIDDNDELTKEYLRKSKELEVGLIDSIEKVNEERKKDNTSVIKAEEYIQQLKINNKKAQDDLDKKYREDVKKRELEERLALKEHLEAMKQLRLEFAQIEADARDKNENLDDLREYYQARENAYKKYANDKEKLDLELARLDERLNEDSLKRSIEIANSRIEAIKKVYAELLATDDELLSDQDLKQKKEFQAQIKDYETEVVNAEIQLQDLRANQQERQLEQTKSVWKKSADAISSILEAVQNKINEMYDKQIANENRLIDKSKQRIDYLTQAAAMGNQQATDSILAEEKKQEEAQRNIERIEKNKQRSQFITSMLSVLNQKIANGDKNPVLSTISDSVIMNSFLKGLPSFKEGTEYFSTEGKGVDGQGGKLSILHDKERIMTAEQNQKIGFATPNDMVADIVYKYRSGELKSSDYGYSVDYNTLMKPIVDEIKEGFSNITTTNYDVEKLVSNVLSVVKTTQKGRVSIIDKRNYRA